MVGQEKDQDPKDIAKKDSQPKYSTTQSQAFFNRPEPTLNLLLEPKNHCTTMEFFLSNSKAFTRQIYYLRSRKDCHTNLKDNNLRC